MTDASAQLETEYIFIDAQVFVREKFDWSSKSFCRIKELVKSGQVRVLTTSITKNEVVNKIKETLSHTLTALKRHEVLLDQLGVSAGSATGAEGKLQSLFEDFLLEVSAEEVPLSANLNNVFGDYFTQKPPFSAKKKSEFPDAIVVASLRDFSSKRGAKIYVVSGDGDLKECCGERGSLIHAESLGDVISRATVTQKLHDTLLQFLANSDYLKDNLASKLKYKDVYVRGLSRFSDHLEVSGSVTDARDVSVQHLNVLSEDADQTFVCVIEFETHLCIDLEIEVGGRMFTGGGFEPSERLSESEYATELFIAEVILRFDPTNAGKSEFESVDCNPDIEIDGTEIEALRRFR
jgi:hypothetical protein